MLFSTNICSGFLVTPKYMCRFSLPLVLLVMFRASSHVNLSLVMLEWLTRWGLLLSRVFRFGRTTCIRLVWM